MAKVRTLLPQEYKRFRRMFKALKVKVEKAEPKEFEELSHIGRATRVKKMTPAIVPYGTVPKWYYRQLVALRKQTSNGRINVFPAKKPKKKTSRIFRFRIKSDIDASSAYQVKVAYFSSTKAKAIEKFKEDYCAMFSCGFTLTQIVHLKNGKCKHILVASKKRELCGCSERRIHYY